MILFFKSNYQNTIFNKNSTNLFSTLMDRKLFFKDNFQTDLGAHVLFSNMVRCASTPIFFHFFCLYSFFDIKT